MKINGKDPSEWDIKIGNWEPQNPIIKAIVGFLVGIFVVGLVTLIMFGVMGPVLGIVVVITVIAVLGGLGLSLLGIIIPLAIFLAPIIFILWIISIII